MRSDRIEKIILAALSFFIIFDLVWVAIDGTHDHWALATLMAAASTIGALALGYAFAMRSMHREIEHKSAKRMAAAQRVRSMPFGVEDDEIEAILEEEGYRD